MRIPGDPGQARRAPPGRAGRRALSPSPAVAHARAPRSQDRRPGTRARGHADQPDPFLHAASNFANARLALALRERYGLPVVYEVRGFWEDTWLSRHPDAAQLAGSELYRQSRDLETRCMLAADLVVTLGEAMREEIVARGVAAEKILLVPNAVSGEFLRPLPDATALRTALGIDPDEYVVGVVSSLVPQEGIGTLLEATAMLRARRVPARALLVGDGPERAALQRQAGAVAGRAAGGPAGRLRRGRAHRGTAVAAHVPRRPADPRPARGQVLALAELAGLAGRGRDGDRLPGAPAGLRSLVPLLARHVLAQPVRRVLPVGTGVLVRRVLRDQTSRR